MLLIIAIMLLLAYDVFRRCRYAAIITLLMPFSPYFSFLLTLIFDMPRMLLPLRHAAMIAALLMLPYAADMLIYYVISIALLAAILLPLRRCCAMPVTLRYYAE